MNAIGFRATPTEITYAITCLQDNVLQLLAVEHIKLPLSLIFPEKLNFLRTTVKDLILEFHIIRAGIRTIESSSSNVNIERISFEAVLQELLSSSTIEKYLAAEISTMFPKLQIEKVQFKKLVNDKKASYRNIELDSFKPNQREAILVSIASLNI